LFLPHAFSNAFQLFGNADNLYLYFKHNKNGAKWGTFHGLNGNSEAVWQVGKTEVLVVKRGSGHGKLFLFKSGKGRSLLWK
jgi:hypothetical protein